MMMKNCGILLEVNILLSGESFENCIRYKQKSCNLEYKYFYMKKVLLKRFFQRITPDFIEYLEFFSNGDIEVAIYYKKEN